MGFWFRSKDEVGIGFKGEGMGSMLCTHFFFPLCRPLPLPVRKIQVES